jgi:3',5'-cyclic-AMP phosphodiesterase
MDPKPLRIVQLTDSHLFADRRQTLVGCSTNDSFASVVDYLAAQPEPPDLLLLTGDLAQDDSAAAYRYLRATIAPLQVTAYWLLGNHDQNQAAIAAELGQAPCDPSKDIEVAGWRLILVGTMVVNEPQGRIEPAALEALDRRLSQDVALVRPTLIALHHHPLPIGSAFMDSIALENAADFLAIVDRHPQVRVVIFGHIHQAFDQWRNGVRYLGTPSTCIQLRPGVAGVEWDELGPGFRVIELGPGGQVETWVDFLGGRQGQRLGLQ